jgi:hypothetical protein
MSDGLTRLIRPLALMTLIKNLGHHTLVVLFPLIPLPNPSAKGLDFGVFGALGLEVFLVGFLRFLLI